MKDEEDFILFCCGVRQARLVVYSIIGSITHGPALAPPPSNPPFLPSHHQKKTNFLAPFLTFVRRTKQPPSPPNLRFIIPQNGAAGHHHRWASGSPALEPIHGRHYRGGHGFFFLPGCRVECAAPAAVQEPPGTAVGVPLGAGCGEYGCVRDRSVSLFFSVSGEGLMASSPFPYPLRGSALADDDHDGEHSMVMSSHLCFLGRRRRSFWGPRAMSLFSIAS